jgi:hypothetical protein
VGTHLPGRSELVNFLEFTNGLYLG